MFIVLRLKNIVIFTIIFLVSALLLTSSLYFAGSSGDFAEEEQSFLKKDGIKLPIIMYHSVLKSRGGKYIVSPAQLENDFNYIRNQGFKTVTINDLIDYVYNEGDLPEKPIIITFDDGFLNNITYVVPLLEKYEMKAVISIVGIYTETESDMTNRKPDFSYLNWQEVKNLADSEIVEIQNHSYDLHRQTKNRKGAVKNRFESLEDYEQVMGEDLDKFKEALLLNTGREAAAYTYPFGNYCRESEDMLKKEGLLASVTCRERINYINKEPECLYLLGRFNRPSGVPSDEFFAKVLKNYD